MIVSLAVGIVITLLAAIRPALRATRVPPIAAVREGAILPPSRFARFGRLAGVGTVILAVVLLLLGLLGGGLSTGVRLISLGLGTVILFIGVSMLAPTLVPPLVKVLGWPATKIGGAAGLLARGNATRNPSRTAQTAAALMIGLALVTLVGVLAAGLRSRFTDAVDKLFVANYAVTAENNFSPISVSSENALRKVPGVLVVSGVRAGDAKAFGSRINLTGGRAERQPGDRRQVAGRQPADAGAAGQRRRVRQQGLRQGAAPQGRLAAVGPDPHRIGHAPDAARHLRAAEGRQPVRRRDDLDAAV